MRRIFTATLFVALSPLMTPAQEIPSPAGLWCAACQPVDRVTGRVRTLLSSSRKGERHSRTNVITYDQQGRVVDYLTHSFGESMSDTNLIQDFGRTYVLAYDSKGRLVKEDLYFTEGAKVSFPIKYLYNNGGRLSEEHKLKDDGTPERVSRFTYEPDKRTIIITTTFYRDGRADKPDKTVLTYNAKGQWVRQAFYLSDGSSLGAREFSYNENGDIAKTSEYNKDGKYVYADVFTYKYDSHGNWYEKRDMLTNVIEGKVVERPDWEVTYRVLTYFDDK